MGGNWKNQELPENVKQWKRGKGRKKKKSLVGCGKLKYSECGKVKGYREIWETGQQADTSIKHTSKFDHI